MNACTPTGRSLQTPLIALAVVAFLAAAAPAHAEEGGRSVIADPSLAYGDWAERVPLEMPPAARGVAPEIALIASHRTTESVVGAGWRLEAGSVIRRRSLSNGVPKSAEDLAESLFLVDGMELVAVTEPGVDHYQPETYDGSRYDYVPSSNTWTRKRDGWTWTYGDTAANATRAIALSPQPLPLCAEPCNTEAWFLHSVVDPFGTSIHYAYTVTAMPAAMASTYTGYPSTSRDHLIWTITYGAGTAVVTFTYGREDRPDVTVDMSGGFPVVHNRRLTQIRSTAGDQMFSKYMFQYEDQGGHDGTLGTLTDCDNEPTVADPAPARSLLRKLHRVSETVTAPISDTPRIPATPKKVIRCNRYHHENIGWEEEAEDLTALIANPFIPGTFDPLKDSWTPIPVEIDGDGRTDLVMLAYSEFGDTFTYHKVFIATPNRPNPFAPKGSGGDTGVFAAAWEAELNATMHVGIFGNRQGRALADIDGDSIPEILVESGGGVTIKTSTPVNDSEGMLSRVDFDPVVNELVNCDLRYGELADVDGDHRLDLVVRAHGGSAGCGDEPETTWIRNLGTTPWFVSANKRSLSVPLEREVAPPGWDEALDECPNEAVAPPLDYNQNWSTEGYLADQARFGDFNHDRVLDIAYALYACWTTVSNRWRPWLDSTYSRIFFGKGDGSFVDSGLPAGAPVLLDSLDWGASDTDDSRIAGGTLGAIDLDRDGRGELLQSTFDSGSGFGFGWASCSSVVPPTHPENGGFGVSPDALLTEHEIISYAGPAWDCDQRTTTTAWGDFDGDGFLDIITISGGEVALVPWWNAELRRSGREISEGRLVASDNEHGGRSELTWGFSAQLPNSNPELVINLEVLQSVTGPSGTRALTYHGAILYGDEVTPFAEVTVTGDRGGIEAYSFVTSPWGFGKQHLGVRYRENRSVHVTVLVNGEMYPFGFYVNWTRPRFNPLIRRCEYDVGIALIDLDTADDDCRELAWLAPPVPQTGGFVDKDVIQVTDDNYQMLLGRDRKTDTPERQATYAKV